MNANMCHGRRRRGCPRQPTSRSRPGRKTSPRCRRSPSSSRTCATTCTTAASRTGDRWMRKHIDPYARWAMAHNSLLIVTFDENAGGTVNSIATLLVGAGVRPGVYNERLNHYGLLRTIEDMYGLPPLGYAADANRCAASGPQPPARRRPPRRPAHQRRRSRAGTRLGVLGTTAHVDEPLAHRAPAVGRAGARPRPRATRSSARPSSSRPAGAADRVVAGATAPTG